jgi:uncharacterized protein
MLATASRLPFDSPIGAELAESAGRLQVLLLRENAVGETTDGYVAQRPPPCRRRSKPLVRCGGRRDTVALVRDDELVSEIGRRLAQLAPPNSTIILVGSRAHGDDSSDSDFDVLVIEPEVSDWMQESVGLRRGLDGLHVPVDVIVVSADEAKQRGSVPRTVFDRAQREGTILAQT